MGRYYAKIGSKTHRLYESEKVSRRVFEASIQYRIDSGYELLKGESTPDRAVLKKTYKTTTRKIVMKLWIQEE